MAFSNVDRDKTTNFLSDETFDVLVIGGGITGAGIALDATSRGMKTAVLDMQDFSAGASSSLTQLSGVAIHYLERRGTNGITDAGKEIAILSKNAPHLMKRESVLLPLYRQRSLNKLRTNIGLTMYDRIIGVAKKKRHEIFSEKETRQLEPLLVVDQLIGSALYTDYSIDAPRLTIELLKRSVQLGATALNYVKVMQFIYNKQRKIIGVEVEDQITGENIYIYASKIVNASGAWIDDVRELDSPKLEERHQWIKAVQLVFDQKKLPITESIYFQHRDGRMIFALLKKDKVYVGTETLPSDDRNVSVVEEEDKYYLLDAINELFPKITLEINDILSSWVGTEVSPTVDKKTINKSSFKDGIFVDKSGLISVMGGALTAYRKVAAKVVDSIARQFKKEKGILYSLSETKSLPISGSDFDGTTGFRTFKKEQLKRKDLPFSTYQKHIYINRYGKNVEKIWENYTRYYKEAERYGVDPLIFAELVYALVEECIYMPLDFFIRRTGDIYSDIDVVKENGAGVLAFLSERLYWNKEEIAYYKRELQLAIQQINC
ncbi:glycerol-3-phosphate dehydrogenase/oxidase [Paraliobacillus salinarum]|uniref:glycerol-3-phosphate dehydrogenase/oxidase n=1 Tax=Paraliobacillus salinarum TaxID=1158996 RepID=UPI0015F58804|nr:glycerol-3-phosphate dehydrogenase/oxidase [Paraliobacillus salinarum]